jgi:hypothetical protein
VGLKARRTSMFADLQSAIDQHHEALRAWRKDDLTTDD